MTDRSNIPILIIDDSDEDYYTTIRAFKKTGVMNPVYRCKDGDDALRFLFREGEYALPSDAPRPGIILLDLNLPGTDGREVLQKIKRHLTLKKIPVIILTTSTNERDIDECYSGGANSYIHKPVDLTQFIKTIRALKDYWLDAVILPEWN